MPFLAARRTEEALWAKEKADRAREEGGGEAVGASTAIAVSSARWSSV